MPGLLQNRIAVVTGSGSGIDRDLKPCLESACDTQAAL
jgi:hypothetical protein